MADATSTPDLADIARLAKRLGVASGHARYEDVQDALTSASDRFRSATGHQVHKVTEELIVNGTGDRSLTLPVLHVSDVENVTVDGVAVEVDWDFSGSIDLLRGVFPKRRRIVRATVTHGFDPIPGYVREVVLEQAEEQYNITPGVSSNQVGGISQSFDNKGAAGVSAQWVAAVRRYGIVSEGRS